jgi:hypothetical protein
VNYEQIWDGRFVSFRGPGVSALFDSDAELDATAVAEALEAAYEAGRDARDEELAQRIARSRRPKGNR